jgi:hypothetical protein
MRDNRCCDRSFVVVVPQKYLRQTLLRWADTTASRDVGLTLHQATRVLEVLIADSRFSGLTITEVNPTHGAEDGSSTRALRAFVQNLAQAFSRPVGD